MEQGMRAISFDVATGETVETETHIDGVLTEAEAAALDAITAKQAHNAAIIAELNANDVRVIRALLDDFAATSPDAAERIEAHKARQAALRSRLLP